jgi:predicted permease
VDPIRRKRLDDEIRHHIEERVDRLTARGVSPEEARRRAEASFGDVDALRDELARIEEPPRSRLGRALDRVRADLVFTLRQMRRAPAFAAVAVLTLGLGIGASTAIFGLVKAVVLDPLPYPRSDRLVSFNQVAPDGMRFSVSAPDYQDFRDRARTVQDLTALSRADLTYTEDGRPQNAVALQVTGSFFSLFGGEPIQGRTFGDEESGPSPRKLAVVSRSFWEEHLGGAPDVRGRSLVLDDEPYEIVGVMPAGWAPLVDADLWIPLPLAPDPAHRSNHDLDVVGRLAPGATLASAGKDIRAVAAELGREFPASNGNWSARVTPLKEVLVGPQRIQAGWVLLGAVGLLLLLACASVSNLLLARASTRGHEMDLRLSLGAGRARLIQQLLTESLTLAGAGAAVGVALAFGLLPLLQTLSPPDTPRITEASVDVGVILAATATAVVTGILFGLAPAFFLARRGDPRSGLSAARVTTRGGERARGLLVAAQVAVSLTLLFGAGVLGAGFLRLRSTETGMDPDHTLVVPLMLSGDRYSMGERKVTVDALTERLARLPGVKSVGTTNINPFSGANTVINVNVEGRPATPATAPFVRWRAVSGDYFGAADLHLLAGRTLSAADDREDAEPVVMVTETMARQLFGEPGAALDQRIGMGWDGTNYRRIVGVVSDLEDRELESTPPAVFFWPAMGGLNWAVFLVRYAPGAPLSTSADVRQAIWDVDGTLPVPSVVRLSGALGAAAATPRFNVLILGLFGGVALILSLMAVYGLVLFALRQRTREIGVRLALGARPGGVTGMLVRRGMRVTAAGIAGGVLLSATLALALDRTLDTLVFGGRLLDPLWLGAATLTVAVAAVGATWIPASRATRVDPREALSAE